jgi:hypothetical protein
MVSASFWALAIMALTMTLVNATRAPVIVFTSAAVGISCTDEEWNSVLQTMGNATASNKLRQLVRGQRKLACPKWCGKYCAMMGVGCAPGGRRRQRKLQGSGNGSGSTFIDGDVSACAADISSIDSALRDITTVSSSCRALLAGNKTISCPDFSTTDCYIRGFSLWSTEASGTWPKLLMPKMNATGATFCKKNKVALKVETNFVVGNVTVSMWYTNSPAVPMKLDKTYKSLPAPCYIFGSEPRKLKDGTVGMKVEGKQLPVGWYKMTAVSDENPNQPKSVSFTVTDC